MTNANYFLEKGSKILQDLELFNSNRFSSDVPSLDTIQSETELLLYEFDPTYPALIELRQMREHYGFLAHGFNNVISGRLKQTIICYLDLLERKNHV